MVQYVFVYCYGTDEANGKSFTAIGTEEIEIKKKSISVFLLC